MGLERVLWTGGVVEDKADAPDPEGPFEIELLWVTEVDEGGRIVSIVAFDIDDLRAANREVSAKWFAIDADAAAVVGPMFAFIEGFSDHDRARMRAALADDVVVHDRRLAGQGVVEGADAYVETAAVLWELARDIQFDTAPGVLVHERYGSVGVGRGFGTFPEGGAFDNYIVYMSTVARGRITRPRARSSSRTSSSPWRDWTVCDAGTPEVAPISSTGTVTRG